VKIQGAGPRFPDIAGVPRLALDEVDAVVVTGRRDAPEGFQPVASVSPFSFIARCP